MGYYASHQQATCVIGPVDRVVALDLIENITDASAGTDYLQVMRAGRGSLQAPICHLQPMGWLNDDPFRVAGRRLADHSYGGRSGGSKA